VPVPQIRVLPCPRERADDKGLSGPGGAYEGLQGRAGGEDAADRGGLVSAQLYPGLSEGCDERRGGGRVECRPLPTAARYGPKQRAEEFRNARLAGGVRLEAGASTFVDVLVVQEHDYPVGHETSVNA